MVPPKPGLGPKDDDSLLDDFSFALCRLGECVPSLRLVDGSLALHLRSNFGEVNAVPFSFALPRLWRKLKLPRLEVGLGVSS